MLTDPMSKIFELSRKSKRYEPGAYVLVHEILQWTAEQKPKHLTGKELTRAAFIYSVQRYGLLARMVWEQLGLYSSEDLGRVVFQMVDVQLMGKQPQDKVEDFDRLLITEDFDKVGIVVQGNGGRYQYIQGEDYLKIGYKPPDELGIKLS